MAGARDNARHIGRKLVLHPRRFFVDSHATSPSSHAVAAGRNRFDSMPPLLALFLWLPPSIGAVRFRPRQGPGAPRGVVGARDLDLHRRIAVAFAMARRRNGQVAEVMEEGNPVDRYVQLLLILLAFGI